MLVIVWRFVSRSPAAGRQASRSQRSLEAPTACAVSLIGHCSRNQQILRIYASCRLLRDICWSEAASSGKVSRRACTVRRRQVRVTMTVVVVLKVWLLINVAIITVFGLALLADAVLVPMSASSRRTSAGRSTSRAVSLSWRQDTCAPQVIPGRSERGTRPAVRSVVPGAGSGGVATAVSGIAEVEDAPMRAEMEVSSDLSQLASVRDAIVHQAGSSGPPVDRSVLALLVNELLANAIEHGEPPIRAAVGWDADRVRVEIHDSSLRRPIRRQPSPRDTHGRGIWLVDRNATAWGIEGRAGGKVVWFELCALQRARPST